MPYKYFVTNECESCNRLFTVRYSVRPQRFCSLACHSEFISRPPMPEYDAFSDCYRLPIAGGLYTVVDPVDISVAAFRWTPQIASTGLIYATRTEMICGKLTKIYLHRYLYQRANDIVLDRRDEIDHRDNDGLNCRRNNIRLATRSQNCANTRRPITNTSGFKGVSLEKHSGKWAAYISVQKKHMFLGFFDVPEAAHDAYKAAAIEYFGEFANDGTDAA